MLVLGSSRLNVRIRIRQSIISLTKLKLVVPSAEPSSTTCNSRERSMNTRESASSFVLLMRMRSLMGHVGKASKSISIISVSRPPQRLIVRCMSSTKRSESYLRIWLFFTLDHGY